MVSSFVEHIGIRIAANRSGVIGQDQEQSTGLLFEPFAKIGVPTTTVAMALDIVSPTVFPPNGRRTFKTDEINALVEVTITEILSNPNLPGIEIEYRVENRSAKPIWTVDDGWLVWKQKGKAIELSYARGMLQPGVQIFGYFNPKVFKVGPRKWVTRRAKLQWPLSLSQIWNKESVVSPDSGVYCLSVEIGYGLTPKIPKPILGESVEAPVLRWQQKISSPSVLLRIDYEKHTK